MDRSEKRALRRKKMYKEIEETARLLSKELGRPMPSKHRMEMSLIPAMVAEDLAKRQSVLVLTWDHEGVDAQICARPEHAEHMQDVCQAFNDSVEVIVSRALLGGSEDETT